MTCASEFYKHVNFNEFCPDIELLQQFVEICVTICKMMGNRRIEEGRWRYRKILRLAKNKRENFFSKTKKKQKVLKISKTIFWK